MSVFDRLKESVLAQGPLLVSSAHPAASAAGVAAFAVGGNAFDAALSACFMETIALPMKCGLAGDVVALFRVAGGPLQALVSVGAGPLALAKGGFLERLGPRSVGVPGAPDGYAALARCASLGMRDLIAPAVRAAREGLPWTRTSLTYLRESLDLLRQHSGPNPYVGGPFPEAGSPLRLPGLGDLLERFAELGPALFEHEDGEKIVQAVRRGGGILEMDDFTQRPATVLEPVTATIDGTRIVTTPAPTGGPRLISIVTEAMETRRSLVDIVRGERIAAKKAGRLSRDGGTSVVAAADRAGNAVIVVHSNSFPRFGSGVVLENGLVLNNRPGRGFDLKAPPEAANAPKAGRVPVTTLHAWALERDGETLMGATPGGVNQLPWNAQTVTELLSGASIADAVCNPRWALDEGDRLSVETGVPHVMPEPSTMVPHLSHRSVQQILRLPQHGAPSAAADPRVDARALAAY